MKGVVDSWNRRQVQDLANGRLEDGDDDEEFSEITEWLAWFFNSMEENFDQDFPELA